MITMRGRRFVEAALLFLFALAVRLAHGLAIRGEPVFDIPLVDEALYWRDALNLASGAAWDPVLYRPPLLAALLAACVRVLGESAPAARMALLVLSALAAPLTMLLADRIVGRGRARLAGVLVALYAPAVFYAGELLPASTVLLLNTCALLLILVAEEKRRRSLFAAAGVLIGLSALGWPAVLVLLPALLVHYRRDLRAFGLVAAGAALAVSPAFFHNLRGGDLVLISSNGGVNFYVGNHAGADGWSARAPDLPNEPIEARRVAVEIAERAEGRPLRPSEVSGYWFGRGLEWMISSPGSASMLLIRKGYVLINDRDISDNIDFAAVEEESLPLRLTPIRFGLLFALAIPGFVALRRTRGGRLLLLYGLILGLAIAAFFVVGRFRLPLLPLLAIGASAGLASLAEGLRKRPARAAGSLLFVVAALLVSRSALFGIDEDRTWHYHYLRGYAFLEKGRTEEATRAFEEMIRRNDGVPLAKNALGYLYALQGIHLDRAERLIRDAIVLDPGRKRFFLDSLGLVLLRQGRLAEASRAFEEAIPLYAWDETLSKAEALGHLADVREAEGRGAEADSLRAEAGRLRPR
ncbi:MAG: glycosyltransferase family 39 protein [Candidatus Eisenbacteria bacterium]|nr:glycosyltransferase family 39 protein [Candidatus Eisenbacteria bacterium]